MTEEKKKEEEDNCPLSPMDWVMFLSNEFYHQEQKKLEKENEREIS